ncbi:hypothetical protein CMI47_21080 [Candidatus Pacearchaeota archaeon]|nr:hypothetical protein [Candidatus Pacearchaeota archaeon]|tara:strand:- start:3535 stop:3825 length:291 start_codon:yes stop_codon:yes gene_type:complete
MAKYNFKCSECDSCETFVMTVASFLSVKSEDSFDNKKCNNCGNTVQFVRIFSPTSSKISKSKEQILTEAKDEAKKIVEKIKSGDTKTILDVYGEEI